LLSAETVVRAAFVGQKRGVLLASMELASFVAATAVALLTYRFLGPAIQSAADISLSLGNVTAWKVVSNTSTVPSWKLLA